MNHVLQGRRGAGSCVAPVMSVAAMAALLMGFATDAPGAGLARASAACPGAETPIAATTLDASRESLTCLVGAVRAERGLGPVRADDRLARAARSHTADMVRRGYFAHRSPGGSDVSDRLADAGWTPRGGAWWAGEILATGRGSASTPRRMVAAWLDSPPHRSVLLSARPDAMGVGVAGDTPDGGHERTGITVTAVLGRRCADDDITSTYNNAGTDPLSGYDQENDPCAA